jgi:hypothetical protein
MSFPMVATCDDCWALHEEVRATVPDLPSGGRWIRLATVCALALVGFGALATVVI